MLPPPLKVVNPVPAVCVTSPLTLMAPLKLAVTALVRLTVVRPVVSAMPPAFPEMAATFSVPAPW